MQFGNEIWPVYAVSQNIFFYQKNNTTWELVPGPF